MRKVLAYYRTLIVQFKRNLYKTKTMKNYSYLDGSERSMIPILKHGLGLLKHDSKKSFIQLEEFSAGTGISDLTVFNIDKRILRERKRTSQTPVTGANQIKILTAILQLERATKAAVAEYTSLSQPTVTKLLAGLINSGLVAEKEGAYVAERGIKGATTENIIAIEAKVKDWKSGVRQAMRYKEYADYSYLAIYESHINNCLKNSMIFEQLGIGLIGVSDEGVTLHLEAKQSDVTNPASRLLAFERMISVIDDRHESYVARNGFTAYHAR